INKLSGYIAYIYILKGRLLLMRDGGAFRKAKQSFRSAIQIARGQKAKSDELTATKELSILLAKEGRREEGRSMLAEIYNWFTEGFETADLKEAKALLDELSA